MSGRETESKVQNILFEYYLDSNRRQNYIMLPNNSMFGWESDLTTISNSGITTAHEIKTSRSDFLNEAKQVGRKSFKYRQLTSAYSKFKVNLDYVPNYYYLVITNKKILKVEELHPYTGLIYILNSRIKYLDPESISNKSFVWYDNNTYKVKIIKPAKKIHSQKISQRNKDFITKGLNLRYWKNRIYK